MVKEKAPWILTDYMRWDQSLLFAGNRRVSVTLPLYLASRCGSQDMRMAKKKAGMDYRAFRRHIRKAHLTLLQFAELLGMNRNSLTNYSKKRSVPSHLGIIAILIAEMVERNIDYRALLRKVKIVRKKPRGAGLGKFGGDKRHRDSD